MYVRIYLRHRCEGCWKDNWRERERVRESRQTVYDAARLESNAPLVASHPFPSVWLNRTNATICVHPFAQTIGWKGQLERLGKILVAQFDETHEATADISPAVEISLFAGPEKLPRFPLNSLYSSGLWAWHDEICAIACVGKSFRSFKSWRFKLLPTDRRFAKREAINLFSYREYQGKKYFVYNEDYRENAISAWKIKAIDATNRKKKEASRYW